MNDFGNVGGAVAASWMLVRLLANVESPEFQARAIAIMKLQQAVDERLMALMADAKAARDAEKAPTAKHVGDV